MLLKHLFIIVSIFDVGDDKMGKAERARTRILFLIIILTMTFSTLCIYNVNNASAEEIETYTIKMVVKVTTPNDSEKNIPMRIYDASNNLIMSEDIDGEELVEQDNMFVAIDGTYVSSKPNYITFDLSKISLWKKCGLSITLSLVNNSNGEYYIYSGETGILKGHKVSDKISLSGFTKEEYVKQISNLGAGMFTNNSRLKSVVIPDNITSIGNRAFSGCTNLEKVVIPDAVTSIGESAFENCSSLKEIIIPDNVTKVADKAFLGCTSLNNVKISSKSKINIIGSYAFKNCESLNGLSLPESVLNVRKYSAIGDYAFSGCTNFTEFTLPMSVISLGEGAFLNCKNLKVFNMSQECPIESIEKFTFSGCSVLEQVNIYDEEEGIFDKKSTLLETKLPESINEIGPSAFAGCKSLQKVTLSDSIISVGSYAFKDCVGIKEITMSKNISEISASTFENCQGLTSIDIPIRVTSIGTSAFYGCFNLEKINIPDNNYIEKIWPYAFYHCESLKSITIPAGVTEIGEQTFFACVSLKSVYIPDTVTKIGEKAFYYCSNLVAVVIPDSVKEIGKEAFGYCNSLKYVYCSKGTAARNTALYSKSSIPEFRTLDKVPGVVKTGSIFSNTTMFIGISALLVIAIAAFAIILRRKRKIVQISINEPENMDKQ